MVGDMKILIHGTKNAYTTLRPNDLIQYKLESGTEIEGCGKRIGLFDGKLIYPLCAKLESDSSILVVDPSKQPEKADYLKEKGLFLNVVSSDRRGDSYRVEEYIDDSVYIPLLTDIIDSITVCDDEMSMNQNSDVVEQSITSSKFIDDVDIEIAKTKVQIAQLELKMLELQRTKQQQKQ